MIGRCSLLIVLFVVALAARKTLDTPHVVTEAESLSLFPLAIGPWSGQEAPLEPEVVKVAAVDDYMNRYYRSGNNGELGLYVGYYRSQRQGEALHSPLNCLPGAGWQPLTTEQVDIKSASTAAPRTINKLVVERGVDRLLVLYWYQTLKRVTASEYLRKLFLVADAFGSGRTDVALVRIIAPIDFRDHTSEARALSLAHPFAEQVLPVVQRQLFRE